MPILLTIALLALNAGIATGYWIRSYERGGK